MSGDRKTAIAFCSGVATGAALALPVGSVFLDLSGMALTLVGVGLWIWVARS